MPNTTSMKSNYKEMQTIKSQGPKLFANFNLHFMIMFHAIFDIYSPLQSMLIFGTHSPYGFHLYQNKTAFYKEPSFKILQKELLLCE